MVVDVVFKKSPVVIWNTEKHLEEWAMKLISNFQGLGHNFGNQNGMIQYDTIWYSMMQHWQNQLLFMLAPLEVSKLTSFFFFCELSCQILRHAASHQKTFSGPRCSRGLGFWEEFVSPINPEPVHGASWFHIRLGWRLTILRLYYDLTKSWIVNSTILIYIGN